MYIGRKKNIPDKKFHNVFALDKNKPVLAIESKYIIIIISSPDLRSVFLTCG